MKYYLLFVPMFCFIALCSVATTVYARERSEAAKDRFKYPHPCPSNGNNHGPCPGYVIDHVTALACGGADAPANMQWQSVAEGKAKDKWERKLWNYILNVGVTGHSGLLYALSGYS